MSNNFDTVSEALNTCAVWSDAAKDKNQKALTALAQIEADHFTSADMASAAAQGYRDGVASVTAGQEPVDQFRHSGAADWYDGYPDPYDGKGPYETRTLYRAAPVAQQPQAEAVPDKEDFCYCNDEISLQIVSGGGAPEGLYGRVTLKISGEYVNYVRADSWQETPMARALEFVARHKSSDWPERCQQMVNVARNALKEQP